MTTVNAKKLLKQHGLNLLPSKGGVSALKLMLSQLNNFLILLLMVAVFVSWFIGDKLDAFLILSIALLNILLSFWQEYKASKELEALRRLEVVNARVIRDGVESEIPASTLVPGDLVILEAGDKIPADGILAEAVSLLVNESALSGESLPLVKSLADKDNQVYFGTTVSSGRGVMIVSLTGSKTKFGTIALDLATIEEEKTPLEVSLDKFSQRAGLVALLVAVFVFVLQLLKGSDFFETFISSTALMVAAVPEGLPAVLTLVLALGVRRMYKRHALVRKMSSVESLGAASVVCTDKTGTLTENKMKVKQISSYKKDETELKECASICNSASLVLKEDGGSFDILGDTTEGALLLWLKEAGFDSGKKRSLGKVSEEIPFDAQRKMMSVLWQEKGSKILYTKGAPESVLAHSKMPQSEIDKLTKKYQEMAEKGLRVLAFAKKDLQQLNSDTALEENLEFLGLIGIADAPRPGVKESLKKAESAGIRVVMITGDNELTAKAIAEEVGLIALGEEVITGLQLDGLDDRQLSDRLYKIRIFARVLPEQKLRIIRAYQSQGEVVVATGDGINDSLALKQAHVGVAMGTTGTDVAKEASDIVILDDNFETIISAIEQGRLIYNNLLKSIKFLMAGNFSEILLIVLAISLSLPTPLLPAQILWINFVTDGLPALALAADPASSRIMSSPPRRFAATFLDAKNLRFVSLSGGIIALLCLVVFFLGTLFGSLEFARTLTFSAVVVTQMAFVFIMRRHHSIISNKYLLSSVIFVLLLQSAILFFPPLQSLFKIELAV